MRIQPFRSLSPPPALAPAVASLPYDVGELSDARREAAENPRSFLHVERPEVDLPDAFDAGADHESAARQLARFRKEGWLVQDGAPRLHPVCLALSRHDQAPFVAAVTGRANVVVSVTCRSLDDLYGYVTEQVGAIDGVQALEVSPVLRRLKQAGTLMDGDRLALAGSCEHGLGADAGLHGAVADHRAEHEVAVGQLLGSALGQRDQRRRGIGATAHQVEHEPPRGGEEERAARLLAEPLQRAHLAVELDHVEGLGGDRQQP